jgi:AAA ATPase-like protein
MSETPLTLRLPAVLLRYWSDPRAESYAESIAAPLCELPGVRRVDSHMLAVLPIPGDPGEVGTAVLLAERMIADYRRHLPERRQESGTGLGVLAVPGWVRLAGRGVRYEPEPLLDDLALRPPQLPRDRVYLTGYAASRVEGRWALASSGTYEGASGARATLFERTGSRPDARPWHNARLLRRSLSYQPRPAVERSLGEHAASPLLRVAGPLGCGKTRLVWQVLGPEGTAADGPVLWVPLPPRRAGEGLAARLLRRLARSVAGGDLAEGIVALGLADWSSWLAREAAGPAAADLPALVAAALAAAGARLAGAGASPRLVFDDLQAASAEDLELLAELLSGPALSGVRTVLVGRGRATWPAALAASPEVVVPPMSAAGITALAEELSTGLDMPAEVRQRLAEAASGFPLALEEDLARMIQSHQLRTHYGNFFYSGSKSVEPEPSLRLVQLLEAEAGALGDPLAVRLLAVAGIAVPARDLAAAAFGLGAELAAGWEKPFLAAGWLHRTRSPWGAGVDLAAGSYARAIASTVPAEEEPAVRRALGEILGEVSSEPAALWHAYHLLAGSAEAVSPILDLAREQPAAVPPSGSWRGSPASSPPIGGAAGTRKRSSRSSGSSSPWPAGWGVCPSSRGTSCAPWRSPGTSRGSSLP